MMSSAANRKSEEPTMEDILSSIRRIIADDQKAADQSVQQNVTPTEAASGVSIEADIAALRSALNAIRGEVGSLKDETYQAVDDDWRRDDEAPSEEPLVSLNAEQSVRQSFGELKDVISSHKERDFQELAREMLRPMLKSWLDENLPLLVERLVKEEIKRLVNPDD